jgi:hypothetical protein
VLSPGVSYRLGDSPPAVRVTISTLEREQALRLAGDLAQAIGSASSDRSG